MDKNVAKKEKKTPITFDDLKRLKITSLSDWKEVIEEVRMGMIFGTGLDSPEWEDDFDPDKLTVEQQRLYVIATSHLEIAKQFIGLAMEKKE